MQKVGEAAAVTGVVAYPIIRGVIEGVETWFANYGEPEMIEVDALREKFRKYCFNEEQNGSPNTLGIARDESDINRELPIYFQMKLEGKIKQPLFYIKKYAPIIDQEPWISAIEQSASSLTGQIVSMIGTICNYQQKRSEGFVLGMGGRGYYYDPTNLFFEEFKQWLVELSKAPLNEKTLNIVEGRIDYLRSLDVDQVFKQSSFHSVTRHETIINLYRALSKTVHPVITAAIASEGAREHFTNLSNDLNILIWEAERFCFYLFRDTADTPQSFIPEQFVEVTAENYRKVVTKTQSGRLLSRLLKSPLVSQKNISAVSNLKFEFEGGKDYKLLLGPQDDDGIEIGVLWVFRVNAYMRRFYNLHSIIEKLHVFRKISKDLGGISGQAGDLLVYGRAAPQTCLVMTTFRKLMIELDATVIELHRIADTFRQELIFKKESLSSEESYWMNNFQFAELAYNRLLHRRNGVLHKCIGLVRKIEEKIDLVKAPEYEEKLRENLLAFTQWMVFFCGENVFMDSNQEEGGDDSLIDLLKLSPQSARFKNAPLATKLQKKSQLQAKIGNELIKFSLKDPHKGSDNVFSILALSRDQSIRELIDVCQNPPYCDYVHQELLRTEGASMVLDVLIGYPLEKYLENWYILCNKGIPYAYDPDELKNNRKKGVLHALARLYELNFYVFQFDDDDELELLESFGSEFSVHTPIYLLRDTSDEEIDYTTFYCLVDLRQPIKTYRKKRNIHGFFESDNETLLQQALTAHEDAQLKKDRKEKDAYLEVALGCMNELILRKPNNAQYLMLRGKFMASLGSNERRVLALNDFNVAVEIASNDQSLLVKILIERARTYELFAKTEDKVDLALADYKQILKIDPENITARLRCAEIYIVDKFHRDYDKSFAELNTILERAPNHIEALKLRYQAAICANKFDIAKADALKLIQLKPQDGEFQAKFQEALQTEASYQQAMK